GRWHQALQRRFLRCLLAAKRQGQQRQTPGQECGRMTRTGRKDRFAMIKFAWLALVFLILGSAGCSKNPGTLNKQELEDAVKRELKLTEISLTENPAGGYKGTGTDAKGTAYTLEVTQNAQEKKFEYVAIDDKGRTSGGFVQHYGR